MIVFGIDPGTQTTGYGVIGQENGKLFSKGYGVITTSSKEMFSKRLDSIYKELLTLLTRYRPDAVSIEELFFSENTKTAFAVGQARGVAILACEHAGVEVFEYTPLQVKEALVGYGRAEKSQLQQMVKTLLVLKEIPKPDDASDALAIAICHAHSAKIGNLVKQK